MRLAHSSIRRILRGLRRHLLWTIFVSRISSIDVFAPSQQNDASGRIARGFFVRELLYIFFDLDIEFNERESKPSELELNKKICEFATVDHMTMFGRALWRQCARQPYRGLHRFVYRKMMGEHAQFSAENIHHAFTAVASRVCLDPCVNIQSFQFIAETVDYHLRVLIGVDPESGMLLTGTPSEPVVAEVAATMLVRNNGATSDMKAWGTCIRVLSEYLLARGIVDKGIKGELFGRLLCILARDQLPDGLSADEDFRYSRPFKVDMFLNELLGNGTVNRLIDAKLQGRPCRGNNEGTLPVWDEKSDFRQGWCNFNHFTFTTEKLPRNREMFQDVIRRLLKRNAALQLAPSQTDWDLLLPVYTGDINRPIERDHLSAIFVQIKNRQKPVQLTLGTEYRDYFLPGQLGFCIQMEFGASWQNPSPHMRWPTLSRTTGDSTEILEPFVFGMQVFGADERTFPFLAKYPSLTVVCGNLVRTLTTNGYCPEEEEAIRGMLPFAVRRPREADGCGDGMDVGAS